jgi:hypothetical protein
MKCTRRNFLLGVTGLSTALANLSVANSVPKALNSPAQKDSLNGGKDASSDTTSKSVDLSRLLFCIALVETGNRDDLIGPGGERSRYQITERVWRDVLRSSWEPFENCKGIMADSVARAHLLWLDSSLPGTSPLEETHRDYVLAGCWHGGLESFVRGRWNTKIVNYAGRVSNLYNDPALVVP